MRYAVISRGLTLSQIEAECLKLGAKNMRKAQVLEQVFCDLEMEAAAKLAQVPGLAIKEIKNVSTQGVSVLPYQGQVETLQPIYAASQGSLAALWWHLRESLWPPITGAGLTVAVLDSGIRKTHRALRGKIVYEANFTDSETVDDIFDHGTAVAYLIAGGRHASGEESGIAPGASLWNIKVLNDEGQGTTESVIMGIEEVCRLKAEAKNQGLPPTDPMYPNTINCSFGAADDGDPDNPIRLACRRANREYGQGILAAAGNCGPNPSTIMLPAAEPDVWAVGVVQFSPFEIWPFSSRGPTLEGITKPDFVFYGTDILTASSKGDDAFVVKSGSSFATPFCAGGEGLAWEMARRLLGESFIDWYLAGYPETIHQTMLQLCIKPQGIPRDKDNSYGYGLPLGTLLMNLVKGTAQPMAVPDFSGLLGLGLGMAMVSSLAKAVRGA